MLEPGDISARKEVSIIGPRDAWDPTSQNAVILVSPFGDWLSSESLLVTPEKGRVSRLSHVARNGLVREAQLRASLESAIYRPLPKGLTELATRTRSNKIALMDGVGVQNTALSETLRPLLEQGWLVVDQTGSRITGLRRFWQTRKIPSRQEGKGEVIYPLLRYSTLIIGDKGPTARMAAMLGRPVLPLDILAKEGDFEERQIRDAIAHAGYMKKRLLGGLRIEAVVNRGGMTDIPADVVNAATPEIGASSVSLPQIAGPYVSLPLCHLSRLEDLMENSDGLPSTTDRSQRIWFRMSRKTRKLINDPQAFFRDMNTSPFRCFVDVVRRMSLSF